MCSAVGVLSYVESVISFTIFPSASNKTIFIRAWLRAGVKLMFRRPFVAFGNTCTATPFVNSGACICYGITTERDGLVVAAVFALFANDIVDVPYCRVVEQ